MGNTADIEQLADINDHLRRQLDKSNEIIVELNHMVAKQAGEIAALRQQVAELQAWKAAVPVVPLKRQYSKIPMGTADYGLDALDVAEWLDKLR